MIRYLLDTSTCIDLIRGSAANARAYLGRHKIGTLGISAITLAELQYGVARSSDPMRNRLALAEFRALLLTVPFDDAAATRYGAVRYQLERAGCPIGPLDLLIGAHALATGATLVTCNEREFRRIDGLRVECWTRGKSV